MTDRRPEFQPHKRESEPPRSLAENRARLVALCYGITGDPDVAEDLSQEALYEAWRNRHKLHDPSGTWPWLAAIARNVCLRWCRARGREQARLAPAGEGPDLEIPDDGYDLDAELERGELVELLDRALALLPPETREVLVEQYVRESPHAEIAERLGLSEGAVAKRLERGRLRLRRLLSTEFIREAATYGLIGAEPDGWQQTTLWCTVCGTRRLFACFTGDRELNIICVGCEALLSEHGRTTPVTLRISQYTWGGTSGLFEGTRGFRAALERLMLDRLAPLERGISGLTARCPRCGTDTRVYAAAEAATVGTHFAGAECPRCARDPGVRRHGEVLVHASVACLALWTPEGRRFHRAHPRIRTLPTREVEAGGGPALVTRFESVPDGVRFEAVYARDTFRRLGAHGHPEV